MTQKTLFDDDLTLEEAEELIKNGADVNEKDNYRNTPLFYVENIDIANLLIKYGANVNHKDDYQFTPIFVHVNIAIYKILINSGADINIQDILGLTVLDYQESIDHARVLISNGAIAGKIESYKKFRDLFSKEQQNSFDAFMSITNNDNDFYQMCLAYQNDIKNHVKIDIKEMDIL
jgi:ankyrin repeat protein